MVNTINESGEMGQVFWRRQGEVWEVRHLQDQYAIGQLRSIATMNELEEVVRWDGEGKYRPLRSEGNLVSGWQYDAKSVMEFREVMEVIYPGMWGNAEAWENGKIFPHFVPKPHFPPRKKPVLILDFYKR